MMLAALALLAAQPGYSSGYQSSAPAGGVPSANSPRRYPGVSDAGNDILNRALNMPDSALDGLIRQQRGLRDAITQAAMQDNVDVDQLARLLKQRDDETAQYRQRLTDRLIAVMRQLSPADRNAFARGLAGQGQGQGGQGGQGGGMPPR